MSSLSVPYTAAQRSVALFYGLISHALFLGSVVVMFISLYQGLHFSLLHLHGWAAALSDGLLVVQFALGHSLLLSDRGRRWMTRMAPLGLGRELSTTLFAGLASLQLLITFLLWSSSDVVWAAPEGWAKGLLTVLYGMSWVLLAKSMKDAGLDVQVGMLGWRSIWRGQAPQYRPFTRTGMFRYSRQPIYSSFTLILWTAPVWTPDHLCLAVLWTSYCVGAPLWKEKRYRRFYGEAYERYQARVPYWFPGRKKQTMNTTQPIHATDAEVIIIGAGPVGMLLGCLLGKKGMKVLILEQRSGLPTQSQAIGITPPSLEILARLGLDQAFVQQGLLIRECHVHGPTGHVGTASFREVHLEYPFILSLPQQISMRLLAEKLETFPTVTLRRGVEVTSVRPTETEVQIEYADEQGSVTQLRAAYAVACDGHRSGVREKLRMRTTRQDYGHHFIMGDFTDHSGLGEEAHLYFTPTGAVESFPLPGGIRRWIVQTRQTDVSLPTGFISETVRIRTGMLIEKEAQLNQSHFSPWRLDCEQIYEGRVLLCGDAAHVMSPIGGQGMNTGFADAEFAAELLQGVVHRGQAVEPWLAEYDRCRRKAASTAATRASMGMGLGTWRGEFLSKLRDFLLRHILLGGPMASVVGPWFAMMTIPFKRVCESDLAARWMASTRGDLTQAAPRELVMEAR
ncbi:2-polyprenyl-6-methoxyphenol hydroxylase [Prosthecobacter debontii]|uniref:2-polyprenyl-6-methoxyphenol hydroxylase n=1 Tax=Prosthecobacter debontii TaxID=48467 RepID=A0A1T4Y5X7_9BACT|nr:FAD-dependent monooxygenase [Prosthecobacter debontii]SKA97146.1 2-polyprenyl-6-methoxyphenol hydroxylase [Prosthecobacter debontii]